MKKRPNMKQLTRQLRTELGERPNDAQYDPKHVDTQRKLQGIMASSYGEARHTKTLIERLRRPISFRVVVGSIALAGVVFGLFFSTSPFQSEKNPDVLALAAQKYAKREGILYMEGVSSNREKRWIHNQHKWLDETYHSTFKTWLTTDGLYSRDISVLGPSSGLTIESVSTPDGQCSSGLDQQPYVSISKPRPTHYSDQVESQSCPFGLGLRPRVDHVDENEGNHKDYPGGLPKSVFETVIDPSELIRQIRAGEVQRHSVEETTESGFDVYVIKAWEPVEWVDKPGGPVRLLDDLTQKTLVLDRETLDIRSYDERSVYNGDGEHEEITTQTIHFTSPPRLVPETEENYHLLQMTFVPSRVDQDPFDKADRKVSRRIQEKVKAGWFSMQNRPN